MGWFPGTVPQGGNTLVVPEGTDELGRGTEQAGDGGNAGVGTKKGQDIVKDKGKGKWVLGGQLGKANTVVHGRVVGCVVRVSIVHLRVFL